MTTMEQPEATRASTHTLAIVSLVLSILGLIAVLPLVGSIAGIVTGVMARREITARPDLHTGEGTARAGIILGWIGVGLAVLSICLIVLAFAFFVPLTSFSGPGVEFGPIITVVP